MQTSELEKKNSKLSGDEECINFRPSPNFKHMKKYLKSKFEEANSSPNQGSDRSTTPNSEEQDSVKPQQVTSSSSMAQRVQPPLPPNSPPPDLVVPKQEVEDDEYIDGTATQSQLKTEKEEVIEKAPERTMCRQFARGMCTRGASCIYVHELILSQLPGVYTFCKNYQNTVCNFPKCKFVHASVFEKEHFYRTGFLPPHTLMHLKESNSALCPPTALEGTPAEASQLFSNPPPVMHLGVSSLPTSGCAPPPEARPHTELFGGSPMSSALALRASPPKRERSELAADLDPSEPLLKKCKTCDETERSEKACKAKLGKLMEAAEMYEKKKKQLKKWDLMLNNIFDMLVKSQKNLMSSSSQSLLNSGMSIINEKETMKSSMLDQIILFIHLKRINEVGTSQKSMLSQILKMLKERGLDR